MADKYIALVNGIDTEVAGTVIGGTPTQAGDIPALDEAGRLSPTLMPVGVVADTYSGVAFENLSAGAFVYIKSDGTVANASAATGGVVACGFVLTAYSTGATALVYLEGRNTSLSGLTVGARYYLSDTTPGGATATPIDNTLAGSAGKKHQFLGRAVSTTSMNTEIDDYILLAAP